MTISFVNLVESVVLVSVVLVVECIVQVGEPVSFSPVFSWLPFAVPPFCRVRHARIPQAVAPGRQGTGISRCSPDKPFPRRVKKSEVFRGKF